MRAGREFDALVAEQVMGNGPGFAHAPDGHVYGRVRPYSTDIAAAWEVVARIADRDGMVHVHNERGCWTAIVRLHRDSSYTTDAIANMDTAPLAICLAALKAVTP